MKAEERPEEIIARRLRDPLSFIPSGALEKALLSRDDLEMLERHQQAIRLLQETERFTCKVRVGALLDYIEWLDPDLLPENFGWRLALETAKARKAPPGGGIRSARNQQIRGAFFALTWGHCIKPYIAWEMVASHFGLSVATVRAALDEEDSRPGPPEDFTRISDRRRLLISALKN